MADNSKQTKAEAQAIGRQRRLVMERKRTHEAQQAALRQRLSAVRPNKNAPARGSVAMRGESRFTNRERIHADDGSVVFVRTTAPTVLRLQTHRQRAATGFMRDWETMLGGLHSSSLEFRPRSTAGDFGHARRIEAGARIREVKRHVGSGFSIMVAALVLGIPVGDLAAESGVAPADVNRELNDALDYAADVYAHGARQMPRWYRRANALAEHHVGIVAWHAD